MATFVANSVQLFSLPPAKLQEFLQLAKLIEEMTTDEDVQNVFELLEASSPELVRVVFQHKTLLYRACVNPLCRFEIIQYLAVRFPEALQQENDWNDDLPLHALCENESFSLEVVQYLVELYPEALQKGRAWGSPLHRACLNHSCSLGILRYLVKKYPKALEKRGNLGYGEFPLHAACRNRSFSLEMIRYLVEQNQKMVMQTDVEGSLPLHSALSVNSPYSVEIVRFLVEQYPEALREKNVRGLVPLYHCIVRFRVGGFDSPRLFDLMRVLLPGCREAINISPYAPVYVPGHDWPAPEELGRYKQAAGLLLEEIRLRDQSEWASQVVEAPESLPISIEIVRGWAAEWLNDCGEEIGAIEDRLGELGTLLEDARPS